MDEVGGKSGGRCCEIEGESWEDEAAEAEAAELEEGSRRSCRRGVVEGKPP